MPIFIIWISAGTDRASCPVGHDNKLNIQNHPGIGWAYQILLIIVWDVVLVLIIALIIVIVDLRVEADVVKNNTKDLCADLEKQLTRPPDDLPRALPGMHYKYNAIHHG